MVPIVGINLADDSRGTRIGRSAATRNAAEHLTANKSAKIVCEYRINRAFLRLFEAPVCFEDALIVRGPLVDETILFRGFR
jgi:hypothetical protein